MADILISGLDKRIEGKYHRSESSKAPVALVLHPTPSESGGNMDTRVIHTLFHSFVKKGFSVLCINFPDQNKSQARVHDKTYELNIAAAALDWLQAENPTASAVWIVGFSFGAWVTTQLLMRRPEVDDFVIVSLPANRYDFSFLYPCPSSGLILHGEQDSIVPAESIIKFINTVHKQKGVEFVCNIIPKADHFFRGKLDKLEEYILEYIDSKTNKEKPVKIKIDRRKVSMRHLHKEVLAETEECEL